jgi:hypothetical protein
MRIKNKTRVLYQKFFSRKSQRINLFTATVSKSSKLKLSVWSFFSNNKNSKFSPVGFVEDEEPNVLETHVVPVHEVHKPTLTHKK